MDHVELERKPNLLETLGTSLFSPLWRQSPPLFSRWLQNAMPAVLSRYVSPALPAAASSTEAAKGSFNSNEQSLAELADIKAPLATADMDGSAPLVYNYVPDADALPEDREDLDLVALPGADQQTANADSERTGQNASVSESIATNFDTTLTQSGKEIAEEMTHRTRCKLQKDWKRIRRWAKKNELQEVHFGHTSTLLSADVPSRLDRPIWRRSGLGPRKRSVQSRATSSGTLPFARPLNSDQSGGCGG